MNIPNRKELEKVIWHVSVTEDSGTKFETRDWVGVWLMFSIVVFFLWAVFLG